MGFVHVHPPLFSPATSEAPGREEGALPGDRVGTDITSDVVVDANSEQRRR